MNGITQFQVKTDASQLQREMRQAEKAFLGKDDDTLLVAMESIYITNPKVVEWAANLRHRKSELNYRQWLDDMNPLGGSA